MKRTSIIKRIGLAGGVATLAASGVLVTTAAGGTATHPGHVQTVSGRVAPVHPTSGGCHPDASAGRHHGDHHGHHHHGGDHHGHGHDD